MLMNHTSRIQLQSRSRPYFLASAVHTFVDALATAFLLLRLARVIQRSAHLRRHLILADELSEMVKLGWRGNVLR